MNRHHQTLVGAAYAGDVEDIKWHLAGGADIDAMEIFICPEHATSPWKSPNDSDVRVSLKFTAVMAAAMNSDLDAVRLLINSGADLDVQNECGHNALLLAVYMENEEMIKLLMENNADATFVLQVLKGTQSNMVGPLHRCMRRMLRALRPLSMVNTASVN